MITCPKLIFNNIRVEWKKRKSAGYIKTPQIFLVLIQEFLTMQQRLQPG